MYEEEAGSSVAPGAERREEGGSGVDRTVHGPSVLFSQMRVRGAGRRERSQFHEQTHTHTLRARNRGALQQGSGGSVQGTSAGGGWRAFCPIIIRRRTTSKGKVAVAAVTPATDPMQRETTLGTFSLPVVVW